MFATGTRVSDKQLRLVRGTRTTRTRRTINCAEIVLSIVQYCMFLCCFCVCFICVCVCCCYTGTCYVFWIVYAWLWETWLCARVVVRNFSASSVSSLTQHAFPFPSLRLQQQRPHATFSHTRRGSGGHKLSLGTHSKNNTIAYIPYYTTHIERKLA